MFLILPGAPLRCCNSESSQMLFSVVLRWSYQPFTNPTGSLLVVSHTVDVTSVHVEVENV